MSKIEVEFFAKDCEDVGIQVVFPGKSSARTRKNARLLAAATDLLEALQEIAACGAEAWGEDRPCVHIARAAIAKATGVKNEQ